MRRPPFILAIPLLLIAVILVGCGGNASPATSSTTPTPTTPTSPSPPSGGSGGSSGASPSAQYVYVSGILSDNVWAYRADTNTGALTLVSGSPFSPSSNTTAHMLCDKWCGATNRWLTADPLGKFLFEDAVLAGGGALFSFTVDPATGALTQDDAIAGFTGFLQQIDPQGRFLVRDLGGPNQTTLMNVIAIDRSTGHLTQAPGSPYTIPTSGSSSTSTYGPAVSANHVYDDVSERNGGHSSIYGFNVGANLTLTSAPLSPYDSGNLSSFITMHPSGKRVYAASVTFVNTVGVAQFQQYVVNADGSLTKTGNPVVTNSTGGGFLMFTPDGKFALIGDAATPPSPGVSNGGGISVYAVDQNTGALTKVAFHPELGGQLAFDATGTWLFESTGTAINAYRMDANSGALTLQNSASVPVDPNNDRAGAIAVVAVH